MSKKVNPVKIKMMPAEDVPVGKTFTMNGVKYIKLSDDDRAISHMAAVGILATTVLPLCQFDSNPTKGSNKSVEERSVEAFIEATKDRDNSEIITYGMPDADDVRIYGSKMYPIINDAWYVDNGFEDILGEGDYFYVDAFGGLHMGNECDEKADGVNRRIGVRAFYAIDPDVLVTVRDSDLEGTYRMMTISNKEAVQEIRKNRKNNI